ncbi:MAG: lipoyl(octanoyl) transferase LipB [Methylovulum sp.]|jgi:lipoyl(octanoyl) transferase|nr:lipoyl(octanoyl) transferase LipB [Methylovulum sp.]
MKTIRTNKSTFVIRQMGLQHYEPVWRAMQDFTQQRGAETPDELWVVEHYPVYTLGLTGKREHLLSVTDIPVIQSDRGGQVTYHGPGQLVIYILIDLKRLGIDLRKLVTILEQAMINTLADYGIAAYAKAEAPGVYIEDKKIGSIGLRIKNTGCYHGLSFNNDMDLQAFKHINPCGFSHLEITQLSDFNIKVEFNDLSTQIIHFIKAALYS